MDAPVTCRPADLIEPEWDKMVREAKENGGNGSVEDALTYAMFPKVATTFFANRKNGPVDARTFEAKAPSANGGKGGSYAINVNGQSYNVTASPAGDSMAVTVNGQSYNVAFGAAGSAPAASAPVSVGGVEIKAPVAGTLLKQCFANGTKVTKGQTVIMIESMKMELEVKAPEDGIITYIVAPGSQIVQNMTESSASFSDLNTDDASASFTLRDSSSYSFWYASFSLMSIAEEPSSVLFS